MNREQSLLVGSIFIGIFSILMIITVMVLYLLRKEHERELKTKLIIHYYLGPFGFLLKERKNKKIKYAASFITTVAYISLFYIIAFYK